MPLEVWDYRTDVRNLVATTEIRARFNRVAPGPPPRPHSHDLGGEIFLVLDGEVTFDVAGEVVVLGPGQAIYVPPHVKHCVYNQSDRPATYYLSVTPHVEPTHTTYDAAMQRQPPRYGGWRAAGDPNPPPTKTTAELADAVADAAAELAHLAEQLAVLARRQADELKTAAAADDQPGARRAADTIWAAAYPALRQVRAFEAAWNRLAPRTMPPPE